MTHLVKHRGPDGFGFVYFDALSKGAVESFHDVDRIPSFSKPILGFGTRRLAILDLSALGNQPMQIEEGRFWITYNGEIYNYRELRAELESLGHRFETGTDTEVILRAYAQWGERSVDRFHGMWAFAICDRQHGRLFCSRDRFGIKPFYYSASQSLLLFGSEIKQVIEYPGTRRSLNDRIAFQYLDQGVQDHSNETFFAGIYQLPAGHSMHVDLTQSVLSLRIEKYWDLPLGEADDAPDEAAVERFAALFSKAISQHLRSDVPVGSCLSGGLDSSSIVSVASSSNPRSKLHAFSSCFDDGAIDERPFIREIVSSFGINSHLVFPKAEGFWNDLNCMIWHQDEPVSSTSVYAQWSVMRAARRAGVPVLLDGQGGDEILCGYRKFYVFYLWHLLRRVNPRALKEGGMWLSGPGRRNWSWRHAKRYIGGSQARKSLLAQRVCSRDVLDARGDIQRENIGPGTDLQSRQKDDLMRYSVPALLHYEDRSSMAHSVESRVPMLDHELATFAVNCRPDLKLRDGWTKWILREALKGTLPEGVRLRKTKLGFETPQNEWLRSDNHGTIRSLIHSRDFKLGRLFSADKLCRGFEGFLQGKSEHVDEIEAFRLLNLELWARVFDVS